jgi:hypothetical protein
LESLDNLLDAFGVYFCWDAGDTGGLTQELEEPAGIPRRALRFTQAAVCG